MLNSSNPTHLGQQYIHSIRETPPSQLSKLQNSRKYKTSFFINKLVHILNISFPDSIHYRKTQNGEFLTLDLTTFLPNRTHPFIIMEYDYMVSDQISIGRQTIRFQ